MYGFDHGMSMFGGWIVMLGFLLQWPTLITAAMFPILVFMYARLALHEERDMINQFGDDYRRYRERTPAFFPRIGEPTAANNSRWKRLPARTPSRTPVSSTTCSLYWKKRPHFTERTSQSIELIHRVMLRYENYIPGSA